MAANPSRLRSRPAHLGQDRDRPLARPGAREPRQARREPGRPRAGQVHPHAPAPGHGRARDGGAGRGHALQRGAGEARRASSRARTPRGCPAARRRGEEGHLGALRLPRHAARRRSPTSRCACWRRTWSSTARAARPTPTRAISSIPNLSRAAAARRPRRPPLDDAVLAKALQHAALAIPAGPAARCSRAATSRMRCARCTAAVAAIESLQAATPNRPFWTAASGVLRRARVRRPRASAPRPSRSSPRSTSRSSS